MQRLKSGYRSNTPTSSFPSSPPIAIGKEAIPLPPPPGLAPPPSNESLQGYEVCEICGGFVKDQASLCVHFLNAHRIDIGKWFQHFNQAINTSMI